MQWFNLHLPILKSDEFAESEPWEIGVWIRLMAYCCEQENGGRIMACADWNERKWLVVAGVDLVDLKKPSKLWTWAVAQPGVLWVYSYPNSEEDRIRRERYAAKKGGSVKSPKKAASSAENGKKGGRPPLWKLQEPNGTQRKDKGKDKVIPVQFEEPALDAAGDDSFR